MRGGARKGNEGLGSHLALGEEAVCSTSRSAVEVARHQHWNVGTAWWKKSQCETMDKVNRLR